MKNYYYELTISPEVYYELFLDLVLSLSDEAIEEIGETIIVRSEDSLDNIKDGVEEFTKELSIAFNTDIKCDISLEKVLNQDWIQKYQDSIEPIEIDRFYIHPSWNEPQQDKINVIIDPALTFGSGHHESTNSCIKAISKYVTNHDTVIDVGCGSGILGICCAKLGAKVDICDTDSKAVEDSLKNFDTNNVKAENSWVGSIEHSSSKYDIVIANIVADVIYLIANDLKNSVKNGKILILSGILNKYHDKITKKFADMEIIETISVNEWITLILRKKEENGK